MVTGFSALWFEAFEKRPIGLNFFAPAAPSILEDRITMPYIENGQLDAARLVAMGYEPQLSRGIRNWVMSASLTVVAVGTVPFVGLDIILQAGGPATVLASWVITSVFTLITVCALAEICSAYPNSGATYHWTGQLAPRRWAPLASYIVGALLLVGNVAVTAVTAANEAQWIASMAAIRGTELSPSAITGIAVGCVTLWAAMNMMPVAILARLVVGFASWQAAVAVVIPAVLYSLSSPVPSSAAGLWNDWIDELGFANVNGYAAIIGSTGALVTLTGFDVSQDRACLHGLMDGCCSFVLVLPHPRSPYRCVTQASAHLAEETLRAHWATPIGMIAAACFSIAAGLWLVVTYLLFVPASTLLSTSSSSSESTLSSGGYGLLITIIDNATSGSIVTIEAIAAAIAVSLFMSGYAIVAVTSRVAFAMARDDALPFSSYIRFLHSKRESPDIATLLVATAAVVILLFSLGDIRAYNWVTYPFFSCFQVCKVEEIGDACLNLYALCSPSALLAAYLRHPAPTAGNCRPKHISSRRVPPRLSVCSSGSSGGIVVLADRGIFHASHTGPSYGRKHELFSRCAVGHRCVCKRRVLWRSWKGRTPPRALVLQPSLELFGGFRGLACTSMGLAFVGETYRLSEPDFIATLASPHCDPSQGALRTLMSRELLLL